MAVDSISGSKRNLPDQKGRITKNGKKKEARSRKQTESGNFPAKRTKCPGVRLIGGRIYDSQNGKTCHQCRQKTMDFTASCKNQKMDKPCTIKFCHKCLLNRYGEKAEEMAVLEDWNCPRCRGICNCSFCMKKRGHRPTGILVHTAKATGFSSVSELLYVKDQENFGNDKIVKTVDVMPRKDAASNHAHAVSLPTKRGKENASAGDCGSNLNPLPLESRPNKRKLKKVKRERLKEIRNGNRDDGILLLENSHKKPRISRGRLKETQNGNQTDGVLLNTSNLRKPQIAKEELKGIQKAGADGISLKENSTATTQFSSGVCKKEVRTSNNVEGVLQREKKVKKRVSKGVSSNLIGSEKNKKCHNEPYKGVGVLDEQKLDKDEAQPRIVAESGKVETNDVNYQNKDVDAAIPLPQGAELTSVAGINLPPEDVGHALQFLEFCSAFEETLDLKEGEPEYVLRELIRGGRGRQGKYSPVVKFHIQLLSLIQKDTGEGSSLLTPQNGKNSWLHALRKCASRSQCVLKKLKVNWFGQEADDYDTLDSSKRLRLLTFLCDEVLCTAKMRSWIDDQNLKHADKVKVAKECFLAAKHKEKQLKQKMLDEVAKALIAKNGAPLSISEHEAIVSQIKTKAAQAHAEMLESKGMVPNDKQRCDALRTEPVFLNIKGRTYWRLKGYSDNSNVLLQDWGAEDAVDSGEKWFTFDVEEEKDIEKHIDSLRLP